MSFAIPFLTSFGAGVGKAVGLAGPLTAGASNAVGAAAIGVGGTAAKAGINALGAPGRAANAAEEEALRRNAIAVQKAKDATVSASAQAKARIDARRIAQSQTIFTSPLGVTDKANTAKKTLLGQ